MIPDANEIGALELHEQCFLLRMRHGWTINTLILRSGFSRYWIQSVERGRGNPDSLAEFWRKTA